MTTASKQTRSTRLAMMAGAVLAAALGLASNAAAQTPPAATAPAATPAAPAASSGRMMMMDPAKRAERFNQRMGELKGKLQITAAQEAAWGSFANALRPSATPMQRPDRSAIERMNTPDRIDHMHALRNQRNAEMDRRADATKAFYGQLTAEQKRVFDQESLRLMQLRGGHYGGHHGGHHGSHHGGRHS